MTGAAVPRPEVGLVDRILRGTLALWLALLVNIAGQVATVPIALHAWGAARYGEWVALTALVGFLTLTDLGVQAHVVNRMCAHHARGDVDALIADLHSAMRVQVPLVVGLWGAGALVASLLPLQRWYGISTASRVDVYLTVIVLAAELLIGVAMGPLSGVYRATGHLARAAILVVVQRVVFFALPLGLMLAGAGFVTIALARVAWVVLMDVWAVLDLHRQNPWFSLSPLRGSVHEGLRMLGPSSLFLIAALAEYLALHGTIMVLQSSIGGADVTQFSTHRTLANMGRIVASQFANATWIELTTLDARGQTAQLVRVHRTLAKLGGWLVGAVLLAFLPLSRTVYATWTLRTLDLDAPLFAIMVAQTILWGVWSAGSTVLVATNRQGRLASVLLLNAATGIGLSLLLVPRLGILGAALAGLISDLVIAVWAAPFTACRAIGDRFGGYLREVVPALLAALALPLCAAAALYWAIPWRPARVALIPLFGLALGAGALWLMLAPPERRAAERLLERLRARIGLASRGSA